MNGILTFIPNETTAGISLHRVTLLVELLIVVNATVDLIVGFAFQFFVDLLRALEDRLLIVRRVSVDFHDGCGAHVSWSFRLSLSVGLELHFEQLFFATVLLMLAFFVLATGGLSSFV